MNPLVAPQFKNTETDFCITVDFVKSAGSPSRVFITVGDLVEAFQRLDETLVQIVIGEVQSILVLDEVTANPMRVCLSQKLEVVGDAESLPTDWKETIGRFLIQCRHMVLEFMARNSGVDVTNLVDLEKDLNQLTATGQFKREAFSQPIVRRSLLESMRGLSQALVPLEPGDTASYEEKGLSIPLNLKFSLALETIERLTLAETKSQSLVMLLKVRKVDFIGESRWQFHFGDSTHEAAIRDKEWLAQFHKGKIPLLPGDGISAEVLIETEYSYAEERVRTHYTIKKVLEVVPREQMAQRVRLAVVT